MESLNDAQQINWFRSLLLTELDYGSPRVRAYNKETAEEALQDSLDRLDEQRNVVLVRQAKYQQ